MCEVEFLGGVVLEERTFDNFSVGRYSTAHYQVVDLEDVQLRIVKVPQTIRLRAQRQRRPRYVSIRYANQDARPTVHRLANSCVSHDYPTFFCYFYAVVFVLARELSLAFATGFIIQRFIMLVQYLFY